MEENSALFKMNKMVENFEDMCFNDKLVNKTLPPKNFTRFTVQEILKPSFGQMSKCGYDSDGTYFSDNYDHYSSGDDSHDTDSIRSSTPEIVCQIPSCKCGVQSTALLPTIASNTDRVASWCERVRRQIDEDGYSSSDSESALDLRIPRKKTPPKIQHNQIPAWVFCTRYSDRPSAGPRSRRSRAAQRQPRKARTAFTDQQIHLLNIEFEMDQYLSESRRQKLADELGLNETSVKIWFQNKRAKLKKDTLPHPLALELYAHGLYNHKVASE